MKHQVSKLLLFAFVLGCAFATSKTFQILGSTQQLAFAAMIDPKAEAQDLIEKYTGEKYHLGDCERTQLWESADESVVTACEVLEGK